MKLIAAEHITYIRSGNKILSDINFDLQTDEHWVFLGPNGSGKSTLINILGFRSWPTSGSVTALLYPGESHSHIKSRISLFQPARHNFTIMNYGMTGLELIMTGIDDSLALFSNPDPNVREKAHFLWKHGFNPLLIPDDRQVKYLSSGEIRRVLLLRSLVSSPDFILLDEPYESLDITSRILLENLLKRFIQTDVKASITVLHRLEEIPPFATHAMLLKNGRILDRGPINDVITDERISQLYDWPFRIIRNSGRFFPSPVES